MILTFLCLNIILTINSFIIDSHAHIGKILKFNMKEEYILNSMIKYNISFSLVSNGESAEYDQNQILLSENQTISQIKSAKRAVEFAKKYPNKIGALIWIKPITERCDSEFISYIKENRKFIYGFKIHAFHSKISANDIRLEKYYSLAEELELPVVVHSDKTKEGNPLNIYNAAKRHKKINFVIVHMGLGTDHKNSFKYISKLDNLYGDTTRVSYTDIIEAVKICGSEKILFGTDNPMNSLDVYQPFFSNLKSLLKNEDYENIMYKNAKRLFKINLN